MLKDTEEDTDAAMETKRQLLFSPFRPSDSRAEQDRANVMRTMGSSMSALPTPRPRVQPLGLSQRGNILSNQLDATSTSSLASPLKRPAARAQLFQTQPQSPLSQSAARARARVHPRPLAPAGTEIAVTQMDTRIPTQTQAETQIQTQAKTQTHRPMRGRLTSTPLDSRVFRDGKWWDIGSVPPGTPTPLGLGPPMRLSKDQSSNLVSTPSPGRTRGFAQEAV